MKKMVKLMTSLLVTINAIQLSPLNTLEEDECSADCEDAFDFCVAKHCASNGLAADDAKTECEKLRNDDFDSEIFAECENRQTCVSTSGMQNAVCASVPLKPGITTTTPDTGTLELYDSIVSAVGKLIKSLSDECNTEACPRGEFAGCLLRLAGHDFMDFNDGEGGSDGCLDPSDPDNAGLWACLVHGENNVSLEPLWNESRQKVSLADFIVIVGEGVMTATRENERIQVDFASQFRFGRTSRRNCENQTRLPDPTEGCHANQKTFVDQLGMTPRATAAIMGVHTLGRARNENSGFSGFWSEPNTSGVFNNNFFQSLLLKGWAPNKTAGGKWQWDRVGDGDYKNEMMLNTDICLAYGDFADKAAEQDCCAWIMPSVFDDQAGIEDGAATVAKRTARVEKMDSQAAWCGTGFPAQELPNAPFVIVRNWCCTDHIPGPDTDCGDPANLTGMAAMDVVEFAYNETSWLIEFLEAWKYATEIGQADQLFKPI